MFAPHLPTLTLLVWIVLAMCLLGMWALWRVHPGIPGMAQWLAATLLNTLAVGLALGEIVLADPLVLLPVGDWLTVIALLCMLEGARRLGGGEADRRWRLFGVLALVPAWLFWSFNASTLGRTLLHDLLVTPLLLAIAWALRRRWPLHELSAGFALLLALGSALMLGQLGGVLPSASQTLPMLPLLLTMIAHVGLTLCMALLCGERARREAAALAREDALTGLPNRRSLEEALGRQIALAERNHTRFAVIDLGVERLREVNALLGRVTGNVLLQHTASRLRECTRGGDIHGRLDGEHFLVIVTSVPDAATARHACERLQRALQTLAPLDDKAPHVGFRASLALWPEDRARVEALFEPGASAQPLQACEGRAAVV
jgi:diguanylate cyclase (GGDEF)-like protein